MCSFVHKFVINSKKKSLILVFLEQLERVLCSRFSATHEHKPIFYN